MQFEFTNNFSNLRVPEQRLSRPGIPAGATIIPSTTNNNHLVLEKYNINNENQPAFFKFIYSIVSFYTRMILFRIWCAFSQFHLRPKRSSLCWLVFTLVIMLFYTF